MTNRNLSIAHAALLGAVTLATFASAVDASHRILFKGEGNVVITGRTMDWCQDIASDVWIFPRGVDRNGGCGPKSLKWTSQFGSVVLSANDGVTVDGMNERGLVVNGISLPEPQFGKPDGSRPLICASIWAQWMLDSFGSVRDAVSTMQSENFCVVSPRPDTGAPLFAHVALSDPSGDSALFGWNDGKLTIHFGSDFQVLSGVTTFESQVMMATLRKQFGDAEILDEGDDAASAFLNACATLDRLPKSRQSTFGPTRRTTDFAHQANAGVLGALRSISTPFGVCHAVRPNFKPTRWRTMYDQKNMVMHFDCATMMAGFWISLHELDFDSGAPVRRISLADDKTWSTPTGDGQHRGLPYPGFGRNASTSFEQATPFTFLAAQPN